jgi:hypothetical protein
MATFPTNYTNGRYAAIPQDHIVVLLEIEKKNTHEAWVQCYQGIAESLLSPSDDPLSLFQLAQKIDFYYTLLKSASWLYYKEMLSKKGWDKHFFPFSSEAAPLKNKADILEALKKYSAETSFSEILQKTITIVQKDREVLADPTNGIKPNPSYITYLSEQLRALHQTYLKQEVGDESRISALSAQAPDKSGLERKQAV